MFTWTYKKFLFTPEEVRRHLEKYVETVGYHHLTVQIGVSRQYLREVIKGRRPPGPKVLKALGLRREVVYVPTKEGRCLETSAS